MVRSFLIFALLAGVGVAQTVEKFDSLNFTLPRGWQKEVEPNMVRLGVEDTNGNSCLIIIFKSAPATADPKTNFTAFWTEVVKKLVTVESAPQMQPQITENGWIVETGLATYQNDGKKGIAVLVNSSGGQDVQRPCIDEF